MRKWNLTWSFFAHFLSFFYILIIIDGIWIWDTFIKTTLVKTWFRRWKQRIFPGRVLGLLELVHFLVNVTRLIFILTYWREFGEETIHRLSNRSTSDFIDSWLWRRCLFLFGLREYSSRLILLIRCFLFFLIQSEFSSDVGEQRCRCFFLSLFLLFLLLQFSFLL